MWSSEQGDEGKQISELLVTSATTTHSHKSQNPSWYLCVALNTSNTGDFYLGLPKVEGCTAQRECALALARPCAGCSAALCQSAGREASSWPCSAGPGDLRWGTYVQVDTCFLWLLFLPRFSFSLRQ